MRPYELNISNWLKVNNYFLAIIFSIWNYICIVCNGVFVGSLHVSTVFHGVYTYFGVYLKKIELIFVIYSQVVFISTL